MSKKKCDYWALAREAGKIIATWPQWKQDFHHYKKHYRHGSYGWERLQRELQEKYQKEKSNQQEVG